MNESGSGAYFVRRRSRGGGSGKGKRAAGLFIAVLLVLTAAICLLVVFLPKITGGTAAVGAFGGKTFYFLSTGSYSVRDTALLAAQETTSRGGAGYIYNDGEYRIIAAVYSSEADARALASVNDGATYFGIDVSVPKDADENSVAAVAYLTGEWFDVVGRTADELQRGNITEAQAEHATASACARLCAVAESAGMPNLKSALYAAGEYSCPDKTAPLAYIRYVQVRAIAETVRALHTAG